MENNKKELAKFIVNTIENGSVDALENLAYEAIRQNNINVLKALIDMGLDIEGSHSFTTKLFSIGCRYGNVDIMRYLIDILDEEVFVEDWENISRAVCNSDAEVVKCLVDNSDIINENSHYGISELLSEVFEKSVIMLQNKDTSISQNFKYLTGKYCISDSDKVSIIGCFLYGFVRDGRYNELNCLIEAPFCINSKTFSEYELSFVENNIKNVKGFNYTLDDILARIQ